MRMDALTFAALKAGLGRHGFKLSFMYNLRYIMRTKWSRGEPGILAEAPPGGKKKQDEDVSESLTAGFHWQPYYRKCSIHLGSVVCTAPNTTVMDVLEMQK